MKNKYILTRTEYGIYIDSINNPESTAYNIPMFFKLDKNINTNKIKEAIIKTINNHPYMNIKLGYDEEGNIVKNNNDEKITIDIKEVDELIKEDYIYPFDLLNDRLYRLKLIKTNDSLYLFCDIHHIIFDGFSLKIFLQDLNKAYNNETLEKEVMDANEYSLLESEKINSQVYSKAKKYYNNSFKNKTIHPFPQTNTKENKSSSNIIKCELANLNQGVIKKFTHENNIKTSSLFYGIMGYLLCKYTCTENSLFSVVNNGRNKELKNSIGMFVKTIPLYCDITKSNSIKMFLTHLNNEMKSNIYNDIYSYADFCSDNNLKPEILFVYKGEIQNKITLFDNETNLDLIQSEDTKEHIVLELSYIDGKYFLKVQYRSDLYKEEIMTSLISTFEKTVLEFITKETISELTVFSSEELEMLNKLILIICLHIKVAI